MNKDIFFNDLKMLSASIYKILEVDLDSNIYYEVRVEDKERTKHRFIVDWLNEFAASSVHPEDRERFKKFFNAGRIKEKLRDNWMDRVFYRRLIDGEWRIVVMEIIKGESYKEDDPIVLLTVRDVDDYIKDFRRQMLPF